MHLSKITLLADQCYTN